ncbi:WecB/TagA/CpsF family glycosyltransferase [Catellatospora sp. TT07R-123]|uniref:WecB/TagA/CpsF family glycosyltransferase n=1 Tax=Catellatospora sp. TT07R-123 TaxID=2733863 RepID=UPI001FD509AC|nr:WecB/TagA/CpsF family glycosyltransferase [Catellatospora sp. TT07R-123]
MAFTGTVYGRRVHLAGTWFDAVTEEAVAERVLAALERGEGGRIITPNVDIMRLATGRGLRAAEVRGFLDDANLVVADGMPLVWASRIGRSPLPERVTGSGLIWTLSAALGRANRSVYLLGGSPPRSDSGMDGAVKAASVLASACPGLRVAGQVAPPFGFDLDPEGCARVYTDVIEAKPDLVFVGLGFPKQERVISDLRAELPFTWFLGCGAAIGFVAGELHRAPGWMQRSGLEWAHRLAQEPGRLAGRYLVRDMPYAVRLLAGAALRRH